MATEIERKFLVQRELWQPKDEGRHILQSYLCTDPERTVRIRISQETGYLTIKGKNEGIRRTEFEYEIPLEDAKELMKLCELPPIEKRRHREQLGGSVWEIDVFEGANKGLVLAEIELPSVDAGFELPEWAGQEVSDDDRYYNANLHQHPYSSWHE